MTGLKRIFNSRYNFVFSLLAIAFIFVLDLITPMSAAVWILYLIPLLMNSYKSLVRLQIYTTAAIITVLLWICYIHDVTGLTPTVAFSNRLLMTFMLMAVTYIQIQRANAHIRLLKSDEDLKRSEERFRIAQELSLDGFALLLRSTDPSGRPDFIFTFENSAAARMAGLKPGEIIGRSLLELFPSSINSRFYKTFIEVSESGKAKEFEDYYGGEHVNKWFRMLVVPVNDGLAVFSQDITDRKTAEEALKEFAYAASHDLQEPLRMVSSYLTLLEKKYGSQLEDKAKDFIRYAVDGSRRMSGLIKDLLTYSRVTSLARPFEEVDLNEICGEVLSDLQVLIREKGARITAGNLPSLKADSTQMHQLLQNLIGNAIKFHGDKRPEVNINASQTGSLWQFSVNDNGIGIDPQFYERVFQVFQRLHEEGRYPGTGIGLALCKKIVERHGGSIWVESRPGAGTTFFFTIPVNNPQDIAVDDSGKKATRPE